MARKTGTVKELKHAIAWCEYGTTKVRSIDELLVRGWYIGRYTPRFLPQTTTLRTHGRPLLPRFIHLRHQALRLSFPVGGTVL